MLEEFVQVMRSMILAGNTERADQVYPTVLGETWDSIQQQAKLADAMLAKVAWTTANNTLHWYSMTQTQRDEMRENAPNGLRYYHEGMESHEIAVQYYVPFFNWTRNGFIYRAKLPEYPPMMFKSVRSV